MRTRLILIICLLSSISLLSQERIYFSVTGNGSQNGFSWEDAYPADSLQVAIDTLCSRGGGEIWLQSGDYYVNLALKENIHIYGGFKGDEEQLADRIKSDIDTSGTVDDWEFLYPTKLNEASAWYDILVCEYAESYAYDTILCSIEGISLVNATKTGMHFSHVLVNEVIIKNCWVGIDGIFNQVFNSKISENIEDGFELVRSEMKNCLIAGNHSGSTMRDGKIDSCIFRDNQSGCLFLNGESHTLNSIFYNNSSYTGGAINCSNLGNNSITIQNCKIFNNYAEGSGGGIQGSRGTKIINCLIFNNEAGISGGGFFLDEAYVCSSTIVNNKSSELASNEALYVNTVFWGNETLDFKYGDFHYCALDGQNELGISQNLILLEATNTGASGMDYPAFISPTLFKGNAGNDEEFQELINSDWSLSSASSLISAGVHLVDSEHDLDGSSRLLDFDYDIGAYMYEGNATSYSFPDNRIYVSADSEGSQTGDSWENGFHDLNDALIVGKQFQIPEIWVAKGTYLPTNSQIRNISFEVYKGLSLFGGFEGHESHVNDRTLMDINEDGVIDPWEFENPSILSGLLNEDSQKSLHVLRSLENLDTTFILDGFEITDGDMNIESNSFPNYYYDGVDYDKGGGISVDGVKLRNCKIYNCEADGYGGGAHLRYSIVENCLFEGNTSNSLGGGGYFRYCRLSGCSIADNITDFDACGAFFYECDISDCSFTGNEAVFYQGKGGGFQAWHSNIRNSIVSDNLSTMGAGIYIADSEIEELLIENNLGFTGGGVYMVNTNTMDRCIVKNNISLGSGGGIFNSNLSNRFSYITNSKIYNNYSEDHGGGYGGYTTNLLNCLIFNNSAGGNGGGVWRGSIYNCVVANNYSESESGGIYYAYAHNCIIWGNSTQASSTSTLRFTAVEGGYSSDRSMKVFTLSNLNSSVDTTINCPDFISPSDSIGVLTSSAGIQALESANWNLNEGSFAIDKGSVYSNLQSFDIEGNDRMQGYAVDLGAYETPYFGIVDTSYCYMKEEWVDICADEAYYGYNSSGVYQIVLEDIYGCDSIIDLHLTVHELPESPVITIDGNQLSSSYPYGNQWYLNGKEIAGAVRQSYDVQQSGYYQLKYTDENGCTAFSDEQHVAVSTSLNEFPNSRVYPNPTNGSIFFELGGNYRDVKIRVFSIMGLLISSKDFVSVDIISYEIDGPKGVYLIEVSEADGKKALFKILKE